jgi:hypothetical protein
MLLLLLPHLQLQLLTATVRRSYHRRRTAAVSLAVAVTVVTTVSGQQVLVRPAVMKMICSLMLRTAHTALTCWQLQQPQRAAASHAAGPALLAGHAALQAWTQQQQQRLRRQQRQAGRREQQQQQQRVQL